MYPEEVCTPMREELTSAGFQELRPLNLLFFDIFKWSLKNNIKVYDFGTFTDKGIANMGLGRFKESFGASGVFRDSFKILF